jgi:ribose transport system substrate-binding protein
MLRSARAVTALVVLAVVAVVIAGCGSSSSSHSSSSSSASTSSATGTSSSGGGSADAQAFVKAHSSLSGLKYPEPPNKPYKAGTGTIAVLACATSGAGCLAQSDAAVQAIEAAGWKALPIGNGNFTPSTQAGLIQQYVQQHVDGIVIASVGLSSVKTAVDAALAAHIPVSCEFCTPTPGFGVNGPVSLVSTNGTTTGHYIGTYIAANSKPGTQILQFRDAAFPIMVERANAVEASIKQYCPSCKYSQEGIATAALTQPGPPYFTAALSAHPGLSWAFAASDTYNIPAVKTAAEQGSNVQMAGSDATPAFLEQMIQYPKIARATVFNPFAYAGWAAVDEVMRQDRGLKQWDAYNLPQAYIDTPQEAKLALTGGTIGYSSPDFNYKAMFKRLWEVK